MSLEDLKKQILYFKIIIGLIVLYIFYIIFVPTKYINNLSLSLDSYAGGEFQLAKHGVVPAIPPLWWTTKIYPFFYDNDDLFDSENADSSPHKILSLFDIWYLSDYIAGNGNVDKHPSSLWDMFYNINLFGKKNIIFYDRFASEYGRGTPNVHLDITSV
tara:strand:- start:474 stop:950 length:477 start_codon:yes stop_codon:yes gene_type:complete